MYEVSYVLYYINSNIAKYNVIRLYDYCIMRTLCSGGFRLREGSFCPVDFYFVVDLADKAFKL